MKRTILVGTLIGTALALAGILGLAFQAERAKEATAAQADRDRAIQLIRSKWERNPFDAVGSPPYRDVQAVANPWGQGTIVYLPAFRHTFGLARPVWFVLDRRGYAINGTAAEMTPRLPFLRDAPPLVRERAKVPSSPSRVFEYIYR